MYRVLQKVSPKICCQYFPNDWKTLIKILHAYTLCPQNVWPGSPPTGAPNAGGVGQNRRLSTNNRLNLENGTR